MKRRKLLLGLGSLAAGGAAVTGTGAFAVDAEDRDAVGTVVNDSTAYLSLVPDSGGYSTLASDGELKITLDRLNQKSVTELDDVFFIENSGTDNVEVQINNVSTAGDVSILSLPVTSDTAGNGGDIGSELLGNFGANVAVGERIGVGIEIDVPNVPAGQSSTATFHVDADSP